MVTPPSVASAHAAVVEGADQKMIRVDNGATRPPPTPVTPRRTRQNPQGVPAAVVAWVTENIEAADDLRDGATQTLARGSGNRLALILALLRELGVPARPVLARSRLVAEAAAPAPAQELDDFADALVEIELPAGRVAGPNRAGRAGRSAAGSAAQTYALTNASRVPRWV